jgi:hypothetical protein
MYHNRWFYTIGPATRRKRDRQVGYVVNHFWWFQAQMRATAPVHYSGTVFDQNRIRTFPTQCYPYVEKCFTLVWNTSTVTTPQGKIPPQSSPGVRDGASILVSFIIYLKTQHNMLISSIYSYPPNHHCQILLLWINAIFVPSGDPQNKR